MNKALLDEIRNADQYLQAKTLVWSWMYGSTFINSSVEELGGDTFGLAKGVCEFAKRRGLIQDYIVGRKHLYVHMNDKTLKSVFFSHIKHATGGGVDETYLRKMSNGSTLIFSGAGGLTVWKRIFDNEWIEHEGLKSGHGLSAFIDLLWGHPHIPSSLVGISN